MATEEEFWQYLQGPFLGNMFPDDCYNNPDGNAPNKTNCGGILNFNTKLVSGVRFRQIRAAPMADGERQGDLGACHWNTLHLMVYGLFGDDMLHTPILAR